MDEIKKELSDYRLQKSKDYNDTATILFGLNRYLDSNNRAYYSVLYALKSVLALEGVDFKRHKDVFGYFNKKYVKEEVFPRELGKKLSKMSIIREASDYKDFYIATETEAQEQLEIAKYAIQLVEEYLKQK